MKDVYRVISTASADLSTKYSKFDECDENHLN